MPNRHLVRLTVAVAAGLIAGIALIHTAHAQSKIYFAPEVSVGGAFTNDKAGGFDLSQTGFLFGVGVGVGVQTNTFIFEPFGRYSYMWDRGSVFGTDLLSNNLIEGGARVGLRVTKQTDVYGILGYAWEDLKLDVSGANTATPSGLMLGGGIEHSLNGSPWFVRAEYTHNFFSEEKLSVGREPVAKVTPDMNVVRLGLTYKFGAGNAPSVFDTSAAPPAAEACDPKMFNCHSPMK